LGADSQECGMCHPEPGGVEKGAEIGAEKLVVGFLRG